MKYMLHGILFMHWILLLPMNQFTRPQNLRRTSYVGPPIGSYLGPIWVLYGSYHRLGGPTHLGGKNVAPIYFVGGPICFN